MQLPEWCLGYYQLELERLNRNLSQDARAGAV